MLYFPSLILKSTLLVSLCVNSCEIQYYMILLLLYPCEFLHQFWFLCVMIGESMFAWTCVLVCKLMWNTVYIWFCCCIPVHLALISIFNCYDGGEWFLHALCVLYEYENNSVLVLFKSCLVYTCVCIFAFLLVHIHLSLFRDSRE